MPGLPRRLLLPLLLAACGSKPPPPTPPPPPPLLSLELIGGADQNPDAVGTANPVAVQLYELTSTARFERADVFALTELEAATLGPDDLGSEQLILAPGERRSLEKELKPGTRALGVVVLFRDVDAGA